MNTASPKLIRYYLKPYRWIGEMPSEDGESFEMSRITQVVYSSSISSDNCVFNVTIHKDGLLLFEFHKLRLLGDNFELPSAGNDVTYSSLVIPTRVLNVYLANLFVALQLTIDQNTVDKYRFDQYSLTPLDILIGVEENQWMGFGNTLVVPSARDILAHDFFSKVFANKIITLSPFPKGFPDAFKEPILKFFMFRNFLLPIPLEAIQLAHEIFSSLFMHKAVDRLIILWELVGKTMQAILERDFDWSVMTAWAAIENIIADWWNEFIESNRNRKDANGNEFTFIDKRRRERLRDSRNYTSATKLEILSWAGELDQQDYEALNQIRDRRNKWIHNLDHANQAEAHLAINILVDLLLRRYAGNLLQRLGK